MRRLKLQCLLDWMNPSDVYIDSDKAVYVSKCEDKWSGGELCNIQFDVTWIPRVIGGAEELSEKIFGKSDFSSDPKPRTGLTFTEAVAVMKGGGKVRRPEWKKKRYAQTAFENREFIYIENSQRGVYRKFITVTDMLATDWEVIPQ